MTVSSLSRDSYRICDPKAEPENIRSYSGARGQVPSFAAAKRLPLPLSATAVQTAALVQDDWMTLGETYTKIELG
jgi:hypothetical protein